MALDTYANLKTAIADYLDTGALTAQIDDFIDLAEADHKVEIVEADGTRIPPVLLPEMISRDALTVNARFVALPAGHLEAVELRLLTDPVTVLTQVTAHEMTRLRRERTDKPTWFTIHGRGATTHDIEFDVTPDQSYSGEIIHYTELTPLSDANTSNALLTRAPGAYLYGALIHAPALLIGDERLGHWNALYLRARKGLAGAERRRRRGPGPRVARIVGATP